MRCRSCGHQATLPVDALIRRFGELQPIGFALQHLRCTRCEASDVEWRMARLCDPGAARDSEAERDRRMADGPDRSTRVPVTVAWQAEVERRRLAYADRRRRWTKAWLGGTHPEPPTDDGEFGRRTGRTIHDNRQFRPDF